MPDRHILRVALLQLRSAPGTGEERARLNAEKAVSACRTAKERGADVALLPEMYSMGMISTPGPGRTGWPRL